MLAIAFAVHLAFAAPEHYGQVTFGGLPVPGATVTASRGDQHVVATTDQQGIYRFADLADGMWTITVEMLGFAPMTREVTVAADAMPSTWELMILPFAEITKNLPPPTEQPTSTASTASGPAASNGQTGSGRAAGAGSRGAPSSSATTGGRGGFQRAGVNAAGNAPPPPAEEPPPAETAGAAEGFLVNGSVNNGASSAFAQPAAFGNNRRRQGSLYTYALSLVTSNSAFDARPYSFADRPAVKPDYNNLHFAGTFAGPIKVPGLPFNRRPNVFVGYQRTDDTMANTVSAIMPTLRERGGDFSQSVDAFGRPVQVIDPLTGQPFAGGVVPAGRISPQAAALLRYYPVPNLDGSGFNYQDALVAETQQDSVQSRVTQPINNRNQIFAVVQYQRTHVDSVSIFNFADASTSSTLDATVTWAHRVNQFLSVRPRYQLTRQQNRTTPYFANRLNVSGEAGITGNNQDPINWGPPSLSFSSGIQGLADAQYLSTTSNTNGGGGEAFWNVRRHNFTFGGDVKRQQIDILSQQDPRGAFAFTGAITGSDFADFLLGVPSTSSIAFGNPDKYFRSFNYDAYITDDLRVSPSLTLNLGVRWEYEAPITERHNRLVNLDVASGFGAVSPVIATNPVGSLTGQNYGDALLRTDTLGFQPRVAMAWRPIAGSSVIVRAGYGVYRNAAVYPSIATLLAQQPPLSKAFSIQNSAANPLTLANGFVAPTASAPNTFAVDPDFRVGSAQNWQASIQRDLPASLTVTGSYLGSKGTNLMQEFLPNTYPPGAANPCPTCPIGFVFLTSNGSSLRHAGQLQLRRRLRNGLTAQVQYTLAKATDNAAAFSGAALGNAVIAQDWRDLDAERARSAFDQRHLVTAQFQYTTGVGVSGGTLMNGVRGSLFKGWTVLSQLQTGSGLPLTPIYLTTVPGTGVTGIRANLTGASVDAPEGYYLNPAAYVAPARGEWGNAGRNSARGPAQFSLNAGVSRQFALTQRFNLEWRIDATNVLNRVTYSTVNTIVGSSQFGLPIRANNMRRMQSSLRLRF